MPPIQKAAVIAAILILYTNEKTAIVDGHFEYSLLYALLNNSIIKGHYSFLIIILVATPCGG